MCFDEDGLDPIGVRKEGLGDESEESAWEEAKRT